MVIRHYLFIAWMNEALVLSQVNKNIKFRKVLDSMMKAMVLNELGNPASLTYKDNDYQRPVSRGNSPDNSWL